MGRIRPFFLATNEKDEEIRNKYVDVLLKYYKRTIHQKNKDVEDVLLIMYSMNVIKLISASLIIKEYENILSAKIDIVMEKVYKREKYLLKVLKIDFKKEIREVIEKNMKKLRKLKNVKQILKRKTKINLSKMLNIKLKHMIKEKIFY